MTSLGWSHVAKSHQPLLSCIFVLLDNSILINTLDTSTLLHISSQLLPDAHCTSSLDTSTHYSTFLIYNTRYSTTLLPSDRRRSALLFPHRRLDPLRFDLLSRLSSKIPNRLCIGSICLSPAFAWSCVCVFTLSFSWVWLRIRSTPPRILPPTPIPPT